MIPEGASLVVVDAGARGLAEVVEVRLDLGLDVVLEGRGVDGDGGVGRPGGDEVGLDGVGADGGLDDVAVDVEVEVRARGRLVEDDDGDDVVGPLEGDGLEEGPAGGDAAAVGLSPGVEANEEGGVGSETQAERG